MNQKLTDIPDIKDILNGLNDFFGLPNCEIENCWLDRKVTGTKEQNQIMITLADHHPVCPHCSGEHIHLHCYTTCTVSYSVMAGRNLQIVLRRRRYRCLKCGKTFSEYNPFTIRQGRISIETIVNVLADLRSPAATFASVARKYNVSSTTVMKIFDTRVNMTRLPLSEYMCIDENYAFRSDRSKYICVLVDFTSQQAIDILPNRFKEDMIRYFNAVPWQERMKVKAIGIDMYPNYRDVIRSCFPPSVKIVIDRFHLIREFNEQMDTIRKSIASRIHRTMNELKKEMKKLKERPDFSSQAVQEQWRKKAAEYQEKRKKYYLLKKFNYLLFKNPDHPMFDENNEKKYNKSLDRFLNLADIRRLLLDLDPSLKEAGLIREELTEFFTCSSAEEGEEYFDALAEMMIASRVKEISHFGKTFRRWKSEILNSLDVIEQYGEIQKDGCVKIRDRHLHNGIIERRNKEIKIIKNVSNGYTNFARFRQRVLYVLRDNPSSALDAIYESKTVHKGK